MENWRDIPGFDGRYQISIDTKEGKCRSLNYKGHEGTVRLFKTKPSKAGKRLFWTLTDTNHKQHHQQAARWIAITYPELVQNEFFDGAVIDHIDTDPMNNHPSNLRWVTPAGNNNNPLTKEHMRKAAYGKKVSKETREKLSIIRKGHEVTSQTREKLRTIHTNRKDQSVPVAQYSLKGEFIASYPSTMEAERQNPSLFHTAISACCKGKVKTHGGFIWRYAS